jgi:hypothetical protein
MQIAMAGAVGQALLSGSDPSQLLSDDTDCLSDFMSFGTDAKAVGVESSDLQVEAVGVLGEVGSLVSDRSLDKKIHAVAKALSEKQALTAPEVLKLMEDE